MLEHILNSYLHVTSKQNKQHKEELFQLEL